MAAVGKRRGEGIPAAVNALGMQRRPCEKAALTRGRRACAVNLEPLEDLWDWPHGLDTPGGQRPAAPCQPPKVAFVVTEHPCGEAVLGRDDARQPLLAGRLRLLPCVRVFLWGWTVAP
jgi:hypothetical protein